MIYSKGPYQILWPHWLIWIFTVQHTLMGLDTLRRFSAISMKETTSVTSFCDCGISWVSSHIFPDCFPAHEAQFEKGLL